MECRKFLGQCELKISDTSTWIGLLKEREQVLNRLEEAEVKYLQSLHPRVDSNVPLQRVCTDQGKPGIDAFNLASTSIQARGVQDSRFREINRDSALFGRIPIGQRVRINAKGQISPDPSPDTEASKSLATPDSGDVPEDPIAAEGRIGQVSPRRIPLPPSPDDHIDQLSSLESMPSEAEVEHETIRPALGLQLPSQNDREVREYQNELIGLNRRINIEQQKARITAAIGQELSGWVIVGRGVGNLRGAQRIQGHTIEDIIWTNFGSRTRTWLFAAKVLLLGLFVAAISESPRSRAEIDISGTIRRSDRCLCPRIRSLSWLPANSCRLGWARFRCGQRLGSGHRAIAGDRTCYLGH